MPGLRQRPEDVPLLVAVRHGEPQEHRRATLPRDARRSCAIGAGRCSAPFARRARRRPQRAEHRREVLRRERVRVGDQPGGCVEQVMSRLEAVRAHRRFVRRGDDRRCRRLPAGRPRPRRRRPALGSAGSRAARAKAPAMFGYSLAMRTNPQGQPASDRSAAGHAPRRWRSRRCRRSPSGTSGCCGKRACISATQERLVMPMS